MPLNPSSSQGEIVYLPPGGRMGELIRSHDWSRTPLGPIQQWPQTLLTNLATILESPFPCFICWGRELTLLYNDAYINILGNKHVALGKCLRDVWSEVREETEKLIAEVFEGKSVFVENAPLTLMRHGVPEKTWFDFSYSPLCDAHGSVVGLFATVIEMTEREKQNRQEQELYRALIKASSQVLYRMNQDWTEMRQLMGGGFLSDAEKPNRNWLHEYIHPDDQKWVLEVVEDAVRKGVVFELEHRVKRTDGTIGWTSSRAVPVRNEAGEIIEWFGAASDITERKRAELALRENVHFYNTRDVPGAGWNGKPWPAPEVAENVNIDELGNLGLTPDEEKAIVAYVKTLTDGFEKGAE